MSEKCRYIAQSIHHLVLEFSHHAFSKCKHLFLDSSDDAPKLMNKSLHNQGYWRQWADERFDDPPMVDPGSFNGQRQGWTTQEDPLALHCFCVCSECALLGDLLGVSRYRERDLLYVLSTVASPEFCVRGGTRFGFVNRPKIINVYGTTRDLYSRVCVLH